MLKEFLSQFGAEIINTVLVAIIGYVGIQAKNLYRKYVNTEIKKSVVRTCVKAVEQLYTDIHGKDKFDACVGKINEILSESGINASDVELEMLIESAVKKMNARIDMGD